MEIRFGEDTKFIELQMPSMITENGQMRQMFIQVHYYSVGDILSVIEDGIKVAKTDKKVWMTASTSSMAATDKKFPYKNGSPNENYEPTTPPEE